ncbi:hypothetical protein [Pseudomonas amygdali]
MRSGSSETACQCAEALARQSVAVHGQRSNLRQAGMVQGSRS